MYNLNGSIQALKDEEAEFVRLRLWRWGELANLRSRIDKSLYNENRVVRMGVTRVLGPIGETASEPGLN